MGIIKFGVQRKRRVKGKKIDSIKKLVKVLEKRQHIIFDNRVYHPEFVLNWQLRSVLKYLKAGRCYEIKVEKV